MGHIETRIHTYQKDPAKLTLEWEVEYRKRKNGKWRNYAHAESPEEAERLRDLCRDNNGRYPVVYECRVGLRKFRVVEDHRYRSKSYQIEFKNFLEPWQYWRTCYGSDALEAISECASLPDKKYKFRHKGLVKFFQTFGKACSSTVLCIRYPFLYPRNRFSGKHYTDWKLDDLIKKTFEESHECTNPVEFHKGLTEEELFQMMHPKYRVTDWKKAFRCRILKTHRLFKELFHCIPTNTEMDAMDGGWRKAFGKEMLKEIKTELKRAGMLRTYRIMQIKEKWGELCWYDSGGTHELFEIIQKYEGESYRTCICCGKPAQYRTTGYVLPYCEDCMPKKDLEYGSYREIHRGETGWKEINPNDPEAFEEFMNDMGTK